MTLKELRESKKLTIKQVAEMVGCSSGYLSLIEHSKRTKKLDFLLKLADVYGVSITYIAKCAVKETA